MGEWRIGVAFVRGLNMFSHNRINKKEMLKLCKKIEGENIKILDVVKTDNIIFVKRKIHYASVGKMLEEMLSKHFHERIWVTTRSFESMARVMKKMERWKNEDMHYIWHKKGLNRENRGMDERRI